jgi:hypothetical protein
VDIHDFGSSVGHGFFHLDRSRQGHLQELIQIGYGRMVPKYDQNSEPEAIQNRFDSEGGKLAEFWRKRGQKKSKITPRCSP